MIGVRAVRHLSVIYLTDGQNVVDVQALEERPHGEVYVNQATTKVEAARETSNNLQAGLCGGLGGPTGRRGRVEADKLTRTRGGVREDLADLERVRLHVLGEACPGQREIVAHQVVDREARDES